MFSNKDLPTEQKSNASDKVVYRRLAINGGGAKGNGLPGAYQAFIDAGIYKELHEIAGASAGAIIAAFMATGVDAAQLRQETLDMDLPKLMGEKWTQNSGEDLYQYINKTINKAVSTNLNFLVGQGNLDKPVLDYLNGIDARLKGSPPEPITFAQLHQLYIYFPETFKSLHVLAADKNTGEPVIFNHANNSDVGIALACRASASIPKFFTPVTINGQILTDGGVLNNIPINIFDSDQGQMVNNIMPEQTLAVCFNEDPTDMQSQLLQGKHGHFIDEIFTELVFELMQEQDVLIDEQKAAEPTQDNQYLLAIPQFQQALNKQLNDLKQKESPDIFLNLSQLIDNKVKIELLRLKSQVTAAPNTPEYKTQNAQIEEALNRYSAVIAKTNQIISHLQQSTKTAINDLPEPNESKLMKAAATVKKLMNPVSQNTSLANRLIRNVLIPHEVQLPQGKSGIAIQQEYYSQLRALPFNIVTLDVSKIGSGDFKNASKHAREMYAFNYLDSMNDFDNYGRYEEEQFYKNIYNNFTAIHGILKPLFTPESQQLYEQITSRCIELSTPKPHPARAKLIYQELLRTAAEGRHGSIEGFALSRALEVHRGLISKEDLKRELYVKLQGVTLLAVKKQELALKVAKMGVSPLFASDLESKQDQPEEASSMVALAKLSALGKKIRHLEDPFKAAKSNLELTFEASQQAMIDTQDILCAQKTVVIWCEAALEYQKLKPEPHWLRRRLVVNTARAESIQILEEIIKNKGDLSQPIQKELATTIANQHETGKVFSQFGQLVILYEQLKKHTTTASRISVEENTSPRPK